MASIIVPTELHQSMKAVQRELRKSQGISLSGVYQRAAEQFLAAKPQKQLLTPANGEQSRTA